MPYIEGVDRLARQGLLINPTKDGAVFHLSGDGREQAVLRWYAFAAGVHEHEIACAKGILRHTHFVTGLPEGGGLLVAGVTGHFNSPTKELRVCFSKDATRWHHRG